jgi:hypothetical protein
MGISTQNLEGLPDVVRLRRLLQSMAMLDAILMPEWQHRYYSFNAHWGQDEMMGSMRDGSGDELFALFNRHGAFLKGFAHESNVAAIPSQHFYRDLPIQFEHYSREAAFSPDEVTFCVWRLTDQPHWSYSKLDLPTCSNADGSADMLSMLDGNPGTYRAWAIDYYQRDIPMEAIESVYQHRVLTEEFVGSLNPRQSLGRLNSEIVEIGYPA